MNKAEPCRKPIPQKILVVDDERQVCDLLAEALTFMGHSVQTAANGEEALEKIRETNFHIIVTDMDMPRMDGMELIRHVVKSTSGMDIIAITGHTMKYKYTDVVSAGAADFITKPFSLNELEAKLNRIIRERCLRQELETLAIRDHLTGLYNRRHFEMVVRQEAIRAERYQHPLFLFFCDIDHFKEYNDQYGHQAGDGLLAQLADIFTSSIREGVDTAFRFGGDEFTLLLSHLPKEMACGVAERVRERYNQLRLAPTYLSIGIARYATMGGDVERSIQDMIRRSDAALYRAKRDLGGNHICVDQE